MATKANQYPLLCMCAQAILIDNGMGGNRVGEFGDLNDITMAYLHTFVQRPGFGDKKLAAVEAKLQEIVGGWPKATPMPEPKIWAISAGECMDDNLWATTLYTDTIVQVQIDDQVQEVLGGIFETIAD